MHSYLRTIGFSQLKTRKEQNKLITAILNDDANKFEVSIASEPKLVQISHSFGNNFGISMIGEYDNDITFHLDHSFPYCLGSYVTKQSNIQIEKHIDKEAFSGISDDYNLEMTLIYSLQNIAGYINSNWMNNFYKVPKKVKFGALSMEGCILYGVHLDYIANPYDKKPISNKDRRNLIAKAKSGDLEALENLTLDDMDTYSLVSKRIKEEDLFTVIETYFMPYGINNEEYSILGIIKNFEQIVNDFSEEMVYNLTIECNDVIINVLINSLDLQGEPKIGRRFKGIVWLQGHIEFS